MRPRRIQDVLAAVRSLLPSMPSSFGVADLVERLGVSRRYWSSIREALLSLEASGLVHRVRVAGRRPGAPRVLWSVGPGEPDSHRPVDAVAAVESVLERLPSEFSVADVVAVAGVSRAAARRALGVLEASGRVGRISSVVVLGRSGRRPVLWSCDPKVLARDREFRILAAERQRQLIERLNEVLSPFDPFRYSIVKRYVNKQT